MNSWSLNVTKTGDIGGPLVSKILLSTVFILQHMSLYYMALLRAKTVNQLFGFLLLLLCFMQCILYKTVLLTVVEGIPERDVDEVIFFQSPESEISSISEKSLNMQNCQDICWTDYYSQ